MERLRKPLLLIAFLAMWLFPQWARAVSSRLYTADQLSSSMVDYVAQDHYGYLWVATSYGLNRFDGYRFTHYFSDKSDPTSITSNNVTRILIDSRHRLWVGTAKGLCRFDYDHNCFVRYPFPDQLQPRVECLTEDTDGNLLIGTAGYGLFSIRKNADAVTAENQLSERKTDDFFMVIFEDDRHQIWRGYQDETITRIKVNNLHPTAIKHFTSPCGPVVQFLRPDASGFLAVCMYGILRYDYATGQLVDAGYDMSLVDSKVSIRAALFDHEGNLYLGTSGCGLFVIPKGEKTLKPVENTRSHFNLASANVNYLFEDKDMNIWVSCFKKGLLELNQQEEAFSTWTFAGQNINLGSSLSSIAESDDGGLWCTVQKSGIYHFDRNGHITPAPASPPGADCIYRDKNNRYWVGSENTLYAYDPLTGKSTERLKVDGWGINCMIDDGEDNLYVCNFGKGMYVFNTVTGQADRLTMYQKDPKKGALCNDWVKALFIDSRGLLWIGTSSGVCVMNPVDRNFRVFGWDLQLKGVQCFAICEQKDGTILIGTDAGLYRYLRDANKVVPYSDDHESDNLMVYSLVCSQNGDLWMSSAIGIWQYDHKLKRFVSHVSGNGLETREYVVGAVAHTDNDGVFFGSIEGVVAFMPDRVRSSLEQLAGNLSLTSFIVDGDAVACIGDRFVLDYDQNSFSMEFSLLNFRNAEYVTYEYRVNEGRWMALPEGVNSVPFSRLRSGTYLVEVRASSNGVYADSTLRVTVVVKAPWYATTWAYMAYALLALALLILILYYFERKQRASLEEQKMRFLINATHDIRSPLTLIMGPLNKLKARVTDQESKDDIETIDRNAQRLMLLVNQILDERKIDKKQMHLHCEETDLVPYVAGICSLFHYNAEQRNIRFQFTHDDKTVPAWIDRIQFDKVVTNLLSNAFKFTFDGGEVEVRLHKDDNHARIQVLDSGIGLKEERPERLFERFYQGNNHSDLHIEGTGIGLNLSRAIVQMHGGQIKAYNRSDEVHGACFEVLIPLGCQHLKPEEIKADNGSEVRKGSRRQATKNCNILMVDDDAEVAQYVKNELGQWYHIDTTTNGREALKMLLGEKNYDLVICDVMMPEMDGFTMVRQLKGNPNISDIPVILLTSKTSVDDRMEGLKKGADAYLTKPFNMEELHILIDNQIDNLRRLRGKFSGAQAQDDRMEDVEVKGNDDALMERIMKTINANLQDPDFTVERLSTEVGVSRTQLHRKMKEITGLSTGEFIRNLRLQQAARLIAEGKVNITQVAYAVGFNNQTYFSTIFKRYFGVSPSEYAEKHT